MYIFVDTYGEGHVTELKDAIVTLEGEKKHILYSKKYITKKYPTWSVWIPSETVKTNDAVTDDWKKYKTTKPNKNIPILVLLKNGHYVATNDLSKQTMYVVDNAIRLFKHDEIYEWQYL